MVNWFFVNCTPSSNYITTNGLYYYVKLLSCVINQHIYGKWSAHLTLISFFDSHKLALLYLNMGLLKTLLY